MHQEEALTFKGGKNKYLNMFEPIARALRIVINTVIAIVILFEIILITDYFAEKNKPKHEVSYDKEAIYKRQQEKRDAYMGKGPRNGTIDHSRGRTTIRVNGSAVTLDISPEQIIEQLDIDYHDLRDYYGDELR